MNPTLVVGGVLAGGVLYVVLTLWFAQRAKKP